jgi:hypothetical protein
MALYYDASPVATTQAGGNTMNPALLIAALLLGGGGGRDDRRLFVELEEIIPPTLPHRDRILRILFDLLRGRGSSRELLPLMLLLSGSQASAQAPAAMPAPTTPTTAPAAASAGIDPMTLFAILALTQRDGGGGLL